MDIGFDRVLVIGGAGFIGSHIVDKLLDEGVKVRVIDNLSTGDKTNISQHENNPDFEFIKGDIRDRKLKLIDSLQREFKQIKSVLEIICKNKVKLSFIL